ncbi:MAG: ABC transporter substrate-binding protein [Paracoccaceae bacterium]
MHLLRRQILAGLAAMAVLAPLPATVPAGAETPPNMLVLGGRIDDIITLDPAEVFEFSGAEIANNVYDRITTFAPDDFGTLVGGVAESWRISEDGKTIEFDVREGMTFHSGNPVRPEDAVFSLRRAVKLNKTPSFILTQFGWSAENVDEMVTVVDADTFQITYTADLSPGLVLNALSATIASVVDRETVMANEVDGDMGYAWLKNNSAGSGPFQLQAWNANESVLLTAYPDYWKGGPAMERVIIRHVPEPAAQRLLLEEGDIDIARTLTPDQIEGLSGRDDIVVEDFSKATTLYMAMNTADPVLGEPKVWEALRYLVDYEGMATSFLKGQYIINQTFWPQPLYGSIGDAPYALDVEKAKALLAEAGYADGVTLSMDTLNTAPFTDIAQALQETFGRAGITVEIIPQDGSALWPKYRARRHQLILARWGPDYLDPHSNADSFAHNPDNREEAQLTGKLAWRNAWVDDTITAATEAASKETDIAARKEMYHELLRTHQASSPFVMMFQQNEQVARKASVKGFVSGPVFDLVFYDTVTKD